MSTSPKWRRCVVLGLAYSVLATVIVWRVVGSQAEPDVPESVVYWSGLYRSGELALGQAAPDLHLRSADGRREVQLSALCGVKPVVLLFGSYTCPNFRSVVEPLRSVCQRYQHEVDFYCVYIREAHGVQDGLIPENQQLPPIYTAATLDQRVANAQFCTEDLGIPMPVLVDSMDDQAATTYRAWPVRAYVIDCDGKIIFKDVAAGGTHAEAIDQALMKLLAKMEPGAARKGVVSRMAPGRTLANVAGARVQ